MSSPQIKVTEDGCIRVSGELTFDTVPALTNELAASLATAQGLIVDLQDVGHADSAGLALLIEWRREAERCRCQLGFENIPAQLLAIASVSGVETLLSLSAA